MTTRRQILLLTVAVAGIGVGGVTVAFLTAPHAGAAALAHLTPAVTYFMPGVADAVALTIDDGPDPAGTPEILQVLKEQSAHATFFVIGARIVGYEWLIERMRADGHELGNHDYCERMSAFVPAPELEQDVGATHDLIARFGPVHWFRPGSGVFTPDLLRIVRKWGYRLALGDVFPARQAPPSRALPPMVHPAPRSTRIDHHLA